MTVTAPAIVDDHDRVRLYAGAFVAGYRSAHTRSSYRVDLRQWFAFCSTCDLDPLQARRTHVEMFAHNGEAIGWASATVKRKLGTLAMFYKWLNEEQRSACSPMTNVRRPTVPRESTRLGLGRTELCDWLDAAEALGGDDYALGCLLALNGLRIGEICGAANVEDLGETATTTRWRSSARATSQRSFPWPRGRAWPSTRR